MLKIDKFLYANQGNNCSSKRYVGEGKSTLMSITYRLSRPIFFRKLEKTRHRREEIDVREFCSRLRWYFHLGVFIMKGLSSICILTWRVNNYAKSLFNAE